MSVKRYKNLFYLSIQSRYEAVVYTNTVCFFRVQRKEISTIQKCFKIAY